MVSIVLGAFVIALLVAERVVPSKMARAGVVLVRWLSGLREKRLDVAGFTIPYLEGGQGEPLVLVHGFAADKDNFTLIARHLTPHFRVICLDLPGFGDSTRNYEASHGIAEQVARLHQFIKQLGLKSVHLGGNSMGGLIVAQFAATYPGLVQSLWLLDSAGTAAANETEVIKKYLATGDMPLLVSCEEKFNFMISSVVNKTFFLPYSLHKVLAQRAVADYKLHTKILSEISTQTSLLEEKYAEIKTPALIVWGEEDRVLSSAGADEMHRLFPNSIVVKMPGIGHVPMIEAPKRTAMDYLRFRGLKEASPSPGLQRLDQLNLS